MPPHPECECQGIVPATAHFVRTEASMLSDEIRARLAQLSAAPLTAGASRPVFPARRRVIDRFNSVCGWRRCRRPMPRQSPLICVRRKSNPLPRASTCDFVGRSRSYGPLRKRLCRSRLPGWRRDSNTCQRDRGRPSCIPSWPRWPSIFRRPRCFSIWRLAASRARPCFWPAWCGATAIR